MKNRRFTTNKLGDPSFELEVNRLGPAEESDRGHSVSPLIKTPMGRSLDSRVIGEPKIVIRSEHNHLAAFDHHLSALLAFERNLVFERLRLLEVLEFATQC